MKIPTKDHGECEVDPTWIKMWCDVYFKDDVLCELEKARLWSWANDEKRKTRRGLKKFLNRWIMKSCRLRPQMRMVRAEDTPKVEVPREAVSTYLQQMKERVGR